MFHHSYLQEEVWYFSKLNKKNIFLHVVSFMDTLGKHPVMSALLKPKKTYYGNKKNILMAPGTDLDHYYAYLFTINCLYSNYPKELETKKIHKRISYIFKHNNGKIDLKGKTNKEIYFECCDFLDSKAKEIKD